MNKEIQYQSETITKEIVAKLMLDYEYDISTALKDFYDSETFVKLTDETTKLYLESPSYIYELLKNELKYGSDFMKRKK